MLLCYGPCSGGLGNFISRSPVNPCLLHWQADSLPLAPPEKPPNSRRSPLMSFSYASQLHRSILFLKWIKSSRDVSFCCCCCCCSHFSLSPFSSFLVHEENFPLKCSSFSQYYKTKSQSQEKSGKKTQKKWRLNNMLLNNKRAIKGTKR